MKLTVHRIEKHYTRGRYYAPVEMHREVELDVNHITSVELQTVSARKANVIVRDHFNSAHIVRCPGTRVEWSPKRAAQIVQLINDRDISALYQRLWHIIVPNLEIRKQLRERNEAKRKREQELANAINDVVATITPEEEAAIAAA